MAVDQTTQAYIQAALRNQIPAASLFWIWNGSVFVPWTGALTALPPNAAMEAGGVLSSIASLIQASLQASLASAPLFVTNTPNDPNAPLAVAGQVDVVVRMIGNAVLALGQALSAGSLPVVIASDQSAVPVLVSPAQTPIPVQPPLTQAVTIVDGGSVTDGVTTDAAVYTDTPATISAKMRAMNQTLQDLKANSRLELTVLQQILQQLIAMGQQAGVASPVDLSTAVM